MEARLGSVQDIKCCESTRTNAWEMKHGEQTHHKKRLLYMRLIPFRHQNLISLPLISMHTLRCVRELSLRDQNYWAYTHKQEFIVMLLTPDEALFPVVKTTWGPYAHAKYGT